VVVVVVVVVVVAVFVVFVFVTELLARECYDDLNGASYGGRFK